MEDFEKTVLLEVKGIQEGDEIRWEVLTKKQHPACENFHKLCKSLEGVELVDSWGPEPRARQTIIWQLGMIGKELCWVSKILESDQPHFPALGMNLRR